MPSPINPPSGCRFHTRCPYARERCRVEEPLLEEIGGGDRVACHFWREIPEIVPPAARKGAAAEAYLPRVEAVYGKRVATPAA